MNTNRLNTAELTELHQETLADMKRARTLANISRRAETLWADGYTAEHFAGGCYHVDGPQGQHYMTTYDPEVLGFHCTCPAFSNYDTCKHLLALRNQVEESAQMDRDYERYEECMNFFNGRYDC